jgi:hypothetical protein
VRHYELILACSDECIIVIITGSEIRTIKNFEIYFRWQKLDMEIATYPEFQRDDFAVVAQPTLINTTIPLASDGFTDMTYLSSDCFHISQKSNALCEFTKSSLRREY